MQIEDLVTATEFSKIYGVTYTWTIARINSGDLHAIRKGRTWLIDISDLRGYELLSHYAHENNLNQDSLRRRLANGWIAGKKIGQYWFINPEKMRYIPGYVPVRTYAIHANMSYQQALALCRSGSIDALKHGKFWYVREENMI